MMPTRTQLETIARETVTEPRRFNFERDSFAFANELLWEYRFDAAMGKTHFSKREPKPAYAHHCFVLTRAARQFLYHAQFNPSLPVANDPSVYRRLISAVMSRNPRARGAPEEVIVFPGFANLRDFSRTHEALLKATCGGAWQSYVLRSHWRMIFPISRRHQERTAASLRAEIGQSKAPVVHLVLFPKLTINHGMILFAISETPEAMLFSAYDPNAPDRPTTLSYNRASRTFFLQANRYWPGGNLNVLEIYRTWLM